MDFTTRLAIQAVVRALYQENVLGEQRVLAVMREIQEAATFQRERGHQQDANELMALASEIGKDARIGD